MILQPKRFQSAENPIYDPIRHKAWFGRLLKRKHAIPRLAGCYRQFTPEVVNTQEEMCEMWGISSRDFRDYAAFTEGRSKGIDDTFQMILDVAYDVYTKSNADWPFQHFIKIAAPYFGVNSRHVIEQWEIDPRFYPSDYKYPTN